MKKKFLKFLFPLIIVCLSMFSCSIIDMDSDESNVVKTVSSESRQSSEIVSVIVEHGPNGIVRGPLIEVYKGTDILFEIIPDPGYIVDYAIVNGVQVEINGTEYLISNVQQDIYFQVRFSGHPHFTVTTSSGPNGSITPSFEACGGMDVRVIIEPDTGYMVDTVTIDAVYIEITGHIIDIPQLSKDKAIHVSFIEIPPGEIKKGYYHWIFNPVEEPVDMTTPLVDLLDNDGNIIATVPEALARRLALEGKGFLPDGRLIILDNDYDWPLSRFIEVNTNIAPWGYGLSGDQLKPFKSLAVHTSEIPLGTDVYIHEFVDVLLPDGSRHNGWFKATDPISVYNPMSNAIEVFTGSYSNYLYIDNYFNGNSTFHVVAPYINIKSLDYKYSNSNDWGTGFGGSLVLTNNTGRRIVNWKVVMTFSGNQQVSGWNGVFSQSGSIVTITNTSWNGSISPEANMNIGFNATYSGINEVPTIKVEYTLE